jgi:putative solute:sodium symporter small subunit
MTIFLTNIFPLYFMFPGLTKATIMGFPAHYFLAMFMGWIVLIPFYWFYMNVSENIDREIEASSPGGEK